MNNTPPQQWRRPERFAFVVVGLMFFLLMPTANVLAQGGPGGPPTVLVRVGEARQQEVREHRLIVGEVEPGRRSVIAAEEPGRVVEGPPDTGVAVERGQMLATVDTALLELDIEAAKSSIGQAEASVEEARARLQLTQRERERIAQLVERGVAREKEFEDAKDHESVDQARLRAVESSLLRYRSELARLEQRLSKSRIIAPFDAIVVRKQTEVGQWLAAGEAVAEIVELNMVKIRLDVPETMVRHIPREERLTLTIEAVGGTMEAEVFSIVPDADPRSRTFAVMIHLENEDALIKPGMSVRAQLPTGRPMQAMTVPRDAVQTTPAGTVVFVNRGGVAAAIPVRVRFGSGDRFIIDATAIEHGDQVVVQGNERLAAGQPLQVVEDAPQEQGTAERPEDAVDL